LGAKGSCNGEGGEEDGGSCAAGAGEKQALERALTGAPGAWWSSCGRSRDAGLLPSPSDQTKRLDRPRVPRERAKELRRSCESAHRVHLGRSTLSPAGRAVLACLWPLFSSLHRGSAHTLLPSDALPARYWRIGRLASGRGGTRLQHHVHVMSRLASTHARACADRHRLHHRESREHLRTCALSSSGRILIPLSQQATAAPSPLLKSHTRPARLPTPESTP
jgi:hypothetical protein